MYISHLSLADFRSYAEVELPLESGVTAFVGPNGQGKTNLVEAVAYLATLASHRVAHDGPLVRLGTERAVVRGNVVQGVRSSLIEVEITAGRANRARINRSPVPRPREVLGRWSPSPTTRSPRASPRATPGSTTGPHSAPMWTSPPIGMSCPLRFSTRPGEYAEKKSSAASPWWVPTVTISYSGSGRCRPRATPARARRGRSRWP